MQLTITHVNHIDTQDISGHNGSQEQVHNKYYSMIHTHYSARVGVDMIYVRLTPTMITGTLITDKVTDASVVNLKRLC